MNLRQEPALVTGGSRGIGAAPFPFRAMRSSLQLLLFLLAPAICATSVFAQAPATDVLFVGNSFTHGHDAFVMTYNSANIFDANADVPPYGGIPGIFKRLTMQAGLNYNVTIEAVSSQTLNFHYSNKQAIIGDPKWEFVVLQENSTRPIPVAHGGDPAAFHKGADRLQDLIRMNNPAPKVILYETWTSPASATEQGYNGVLQAMQNDLQSANYTACYRSARTAGASDFSGVARVGDAFMRAVDQGYADPNPANGITPGKFNLWGPDNRHPSRHGSYLSAAVFFGKITGADPRTLATGAGSAAAELSIPQADADQLLRIAYEINALSEPHINPAPGANVNILESGTNLNWNTAASWSAGALVATNAVLINESSAGVSQVANSLDGKSPPPPALPLPEPPPAPVPHPSSIQTLSFDIDTGSKRVQPNLTLANPRMLTLTGGNDALGGTDLIHVSSFTTGAAQMGTNSGFGTLTIALGTAGSINVENYNGALNLGPATILAGNVNLTKTGDGKLILAGANTLGTLVANTFTISGGTVLANTPVAAANSATGAADVSVQNGATLGGSGQIAPGAGKHIAVESGGTVAPGDGLGTLTVNGLNAATPVLSLANGAQLRFELFSTGTGSLKSDTIALVNGAPGDIAFGGNFIHFNNTSAGKLPTGSYVLFSAASANQYTGLTVDGNGYITDGLKVGTGLELYKSSLRLVGGKIFLIISP